MVKKLFALLFLLVVAQCYTNIEEEKMVDDILDEFLGELDEDTAKSDKETMNDFNSLFNSNKKRDTCSFVDNSACTISEVADGCTGQYFKNLGSTTTADLLDACNKLDVCYSCGSNYGKTESECRSRFWEDAKLVCACKSSGQDRCASDAAMMLGSQRSFDNNKFVAAADTPSFCSEDCIQSFMPDVSI